MCYLYPLSIGQMGGGMESACPYELHIKTCRTLNLNQKKIFEYFIKFIVDSADPFISW